MVKPTSPPEVVSPLAYLHNRAGGLGKPYFETLVPYEVYLAVKVYEDRKEGILAEEIVGRKNELDAAAARCVLLESLDFYSTSLTMCAQLATIAKPPCVHRGDTSAHRTTTVVDAQGGGGQVGRWAHSAQDDDAGRTTSSSSKPEGLERGAFPALHLPGIATYPPSQALDILQQEEAEDDQHRAQYGTDRWTRQPSRLANAQLQARAENLAGILESAGKSDGLVRAKFGEWEDQIQVLGSDEVRPIFELRRWLLMSLPPSSAAWRKRFPSSQLPL